jgi:hypothetical protein
MSDAPDTEMPAAKSPQGDNMIVTQAMYRRRRCLQASLAADEE